jgi:hypothetical protein
MALEHFFFDLWSYGSSSCDEITVILEALLGGTSAIASASQFDLHSTADLSLLSIDAREDLPLSDSFPVESEDAPLT